VKLQVVVTLDVTCLDEDGKDVPAPDEGTEEYRDRVRSVRWGIQAALKYGEGEGFVHPLADITSVIVQAVGVPFPAVNDPDQLVPVLREFVKDIDDTGGLVSDAEGSGLYCPAADPTWVDLAVTYEHACAALGVDPLYPRATEDEGYEHDGGPG
jgi:hypothetical protein